MPCETCHGDVGRMARVDIVGTIFMELRASLAATRTLAIVATAFVVLLCLGVYGDVGLR